MTDLSAHSDLEHGGHEIHYDPEGCKIGFWLFLFTEVFLFGMLFIAFGVYLTGYKADFQASSAMLDVKMGGINTLVLLTSSLTMALAIRAVQVDKKGQSLFLMLVTIGFAVVFCVIKYFEWTHKFHTGIHLGSAETFGVPSVLTDMPRGQQLYFGLYYVMTGFHAFHVLVGSILIMVAMYYVANGKVNKDRITLIENAGLFWHLVDLVWIYLFPLFYLIK